MDPTSDTRVAAFKRFVEEAKELCSQLNTAEHDELIAADTIARLANPGKDDDVAHLRRLCDSLEDIVVLQSRHVAAKLRFQLHLAKGRALKQAAIDAVGEILLSAVGGEPSLTTSPVGPLARHYLEEVRSVGFRLTTGTTLQQVNCHLTEALETLERAVSESDLIRRERDNPPQWMIESESATAG